MTDESKETTRRRFLKSCGIIGAGTLVGTGQITSVAHGSERPIESIYPDFFSGSSSVDIPFNEVLRVKISNIEKDAGNFLIICYNYNTKDVLCWDNEPFIDNVDSRTNENLTSQQYDYDKQLSIDIPLEDEFEEVNDSIVYMVYITDSEMNKVEYVGESRPFNPEDKNLLYPDSARGEINRGRDGFNRVISGGNYKIRYKWRDGNFKEQSADFNISMFGHYHDKNKERHINTVVYNEELNNPLAKHIGELVTNPSDSESEKVVDVLSFVQNIPYFYDRDSSQYLENPKYIRETIVHGGGDCSDTASILAAIYEQPPFNYDTILVYPPFHVTPALKLDDLPSGITPHKEGIITVNGDKYVYVESTFSQSIGSMGKYSKSEIRAIYDGDNWTDINGQELVEDGFDSIKRYLTQSY